MEIVSAELHVGVQLDELNEHDAPAGKPVQLKLVVCAVPEVRVAVIVVLIELPLAMPLVPYKLSDMEKLNGIVVVVEAVVVVVVVVAGVVVVVVAAVLTAFTRRILKLCIVTVPLSIHILPVTLPSRNSL